jgi:hypothetical protein
MKPFTRILSWLFALVLLSACGAKATQAPAFQGNNPYASQPGDKDMQRNDVTVDSSSLSLAKSQPPQVMLNFAYFPPTPCHQLRLEVSAPNSDNRIDVTAYSVIEKEKACALMALATPLDASLNLGSFPGGHYSLWLNGIEVGEFDS